MLLDIMQTIIFPRPYFNAKKWKTEVEMSSFPCRSGLGYSFSFLLLATSAAQTYLECGVGRPAGECRSPAGSTEPSNLAASWSAGPAGRLGPSSRSCCWVRKRGERPEDPYPGQDRPRISGTLQYWDWLGEGRCGHIRGGSGGRKIAVHTAAGCNAAREPQESGRGDPSQRGGPDGARTQQLPDGGGFELHSHLFPFRPGHLGRQRAGNGRAASWQAEKGGERPKRARTAKNAAPDVQPRLAPPRGAPGAPNDKGPRFRGRVLWPSEANGWWRRRQRTPRNAWAARQPPRGGGERNMPQLQRPLIPGAPRFR